MQDDKTPNAQPLQHQSSASSNKSALERNTPKVYSRFEDMSKTDRTSVKISITPVDKDEQEAVVQRNNELARQITRFETASRAYLRVRLKDDEAAQLVWDKVVDKWIDGRLAGYNKEMPFRPYLFTILERDVSAHWREFGKQREFNTIEGELEAEARRAFEESHSQTILRYSFDALCEQSKNEIKGEEFIVWYFRENGREPSTVEIAVELTVTPEAARKIKCRVMEKWRRCVIQQLKSDCSSNSYAVLEEEAARLHLLQYVRETLIKMRDNGELAP